MSGTRTQEQGVDTEVDRKSRETDSKWIPVEYGYLSLSEYVVMQFFCFHYHIRSLKNERITRYSLRFFLSEWDWRRNTLDKLVCVHKVNKQRPENVSEEKTCMRLVPTV